jgi:hypothetical protein
VNGVDVECDGGMDFGIYGILVFMVFMGFMGFMGFMVYGIYGIYGINVKWFRAMEECRMILEGVMVCSSV